jgi:nicotinamidase-related amidase
MERAMKFQKSDSAVVFIDPQNDVLSEKGANWQAVGASVTENGTVENMARIFEAAKANGYEVFISPHYFYPTDSGWKMNGPLETDEFKTQSFARVGALNMAGFPNSGADWLDRFKPYINDGKTIVVSPHKVSGRRPTTWSCNSASAESARSSLAACSQTCVSNPTCGSFSSRASRLRS